MALTNAEKQRAYIGRLKALAAIGREYLARQNEVERQDELRAATDKKTERV